MYQSEVMTINPETTTSTRSARRPWILVIVVVMVAVTAFGAGYALRNHENATPTQSSLAQLKSVKNGCDDWAASTTAKGSSDAWCSGMVGWMSGRMGRTMMGSGMWAGPDQMRAACRQWADDNPAQSGARASSTCDDLVAWMDGHSGADGWGMWMMHNR